MITLKEKTYWSAFSVTSWFKRDYVNYEGVPRINIYLLRILYSLMFVFLTVESWGTIVRHTGPWTNTGAAAWCMWAAYATISGIGILRPLKMLPIVLFEIVYKLTWLAIVAYPLWKTNQLAGSSAEEMTRVFLWVALPIISMPWKYFLYAYVLGKRKSEKK